LKNSKLEIVSPSATAAQTSSRAIAVEAHRIDSRDLFIGTREITIGHGAETYRLRLTAQNKLILTK
jgi:hemin uptake protein HemP